MSDFGAARQIDHDPVGSALAHTQQALFELREQQPREARRLTDEYARIASQHTSGSLDADDTIHALAGLLDRAGPRRASETARDPSSPGIA